MPRLLIRSDIVDYYKFLGDDVVEGTSEGFKNLDKPLWLNLGYWKDAQRYVDAASNMARLLGDSAQLGPKDRQLDVGFGFAEQDFLWLTEYGVPHITGLNITPFQVERARERAKQRGLAERLDLQVGSATEMPFAAESFTKVTALECAHHFPTREKFFAEALRVLKPGGRLALCDGVPLPGQPLTFFTRMVLRRWVSPIENYYDRNVYADKLRALGFVNVNVFPISQWVFPMTLRYSDMRNRGVAQDDAIVQLRPDEIEPGLKEWSKLGLTDYIVATADKPA